MVRATVVIPLVSVAGGVAFHLAGLHPVFVDSFGVMLDLRERQFLAKLVALTAVAGEVDRLRIQKRFVEPIELLLDGLDPPVLLGGPVLRLGAPLNCTCSPVWPRRIGGAAIGIRAGDAMSSPRSHTRTNTYFPAAVPS